MEINITTNGNITRIDCVDASLHDLYSDNKFLEFHHTPPREYKIPEEFEERKILIYNFSCYALCLDDDIVRYPDEKDPRNITLYVIMANDSIYTVCPRKTSLFVTRLTYHDEHNPFENEKYWSYDTLLNDDPKDNKHKRYHINEFRMAMNFVTKKYRFDPVIHALMGSTIAGEGFLSWRPSSINEHLREYLLETAAQIKDELKNIDGIEDIIKDLSVFDIIPKPKSATKVKVKR